MSKDESPGSLMWLLVLILFVRWAIVEPFKIPSGSMIPTLLIGDHLFVSKMSYDLRLPFTRSSLIKISDPKRGDVIVFRYPGPGPMNGAFYIKRIIGLPGDTLEIRGGVPYLDGIAYQQSPLTGEDAAKIPAFKYWDENLLLEEEVPGARYKKHFAQRYGRALSRVAEGAQRIEALTGKPCIPFEKFELPIELQYQRANQLCSFTVPEGQYFVMGDNRDDSQDGRFFGFVERKEIMGRAIGIWMSVPLESWQMQEGFIKATGHFLLSLVKMPFDSERRARTGRVIN